MANIGSAGGFPFAVFVNETGTNIGAIAGGAFINETSGGGAFTASLAEAATATDATSETSFQTASLTEAATATDTPTKAFAPSASLTEPASATDSPAYAFAPTASLVEAASGTDAITVGALASLSEAGSAADSIGGAVVLTASLAEAAFAIDSPTIQGQILISFPVRGLLSQADVVEVEQVSFESVIEDETVTDLLGVIGRLDRTDITGVGQMSNEPYILEATFP